MGFFKLSKNRLFNIKFKFTAKRIKKYWGRESEVINPPVDIKRFKFNNNRGIII